MYWEDYLPVFMFLGLAFGLFSGIPVAFVVGGVGLLFGFIGMFFDMFAFQEYAGALRRRPGFAGNP